MTNPAVTGQDRKPELQVLTLTPFYPSEHDDSQGSFVVEPLNALAQSGISSSVFALQPIYRAQLRPPK